MGALRIAILLMPIVACLTGCASGALAKNMIPHALELKRDHDATVAVEVGGGAETNPMWASQISNEAFRDAVVSAVEESGLFTAVVDDGADYTLVVTLVELDQPSMGFDLTVTLRANWGLVRPGTREMVWQREVRTSHTATIGDAFVGITRLRLANEGAAKANIRTALKAISFAEFGSGGS